MCENDFCNTPKMFPPPFFLNAVERIALLRLEEATAIVMSLQPCKALK